MLHCCLHPVFDLMFSFNRSIFLLQFCNHFNPSQIENNLRTKNHFSDDISTVDIFPRSKYFPSLWIHNIQSKQIILRDHFALSGPLWSHSLPDVNLKIGRAPSLRSVPYCGSLTRKLWRRASEIFFFHLPWVRFLFLLSTYSFFGNKEAFRTHSRGLVNYKLEQETESMSEKIPLLVHRRTRIHVLL